MMTDTSADQDGKPNNLSSSLTSMDWLQLLNSENTTSTANDTNHQNKLTTEMTYCRPPYSYIRLIQWVLEQSPCYTATLHQICDRIQNTFPYYKASSHDPRWKMAINETLTLSPSFVCTTTNITNCYWTFAWNHQQRMSIFKFNPNFTVIRRMSEPDAEMRAVNPLEISPGEQYLWKTPKLTNFPTQELVKSNDSISKDNDVLLTDEEIKLFL